MHGATSRVERTGRGHPLPPVLPVVPVPVPVPVPAPPRPSPPPVPPPPPRPPPPKPPPPPTPPPPVPPRVVPPAPRLSCTVVVTTFSPAFSPLVTWVMPLAVSPTVTVRVERDPFLSTV